MRIFFPALIAALCCLIHLANARELTSLTTTSSLPKALSWLRGGARAKKSSSSRISKASRFDDDDDEDDDNFVRGRSKAKKASPVSKGGAKSSKGGKKRMEMVQWNDRGYNQKKKKKSKGFSIKEKLEQIAKTGSSAYKDIYRRAKVMRSSAFEGILLKATWPGNDPVPPELLTEIIKYSIPAFKYSRSDSEDDPYYMTMHKLWTKMSEKDWRTVTKSLFILHCISRDSSAEACNRFALAIKDMSKTRNPKKPDQKYFDLRHVSELDDNSAAFEPFVHAYGAFVIHRTKSFSSRFEELKDISSTTSEKKVIAALKKAQQAINLGLQCEVDKNERNVITGQAVKLVSNDIRELWKLYCEKLEPFVSGESYVDSKASKEDIASLIKFQKDKEDEIRSYLSQSSKAFSSLKIKIPADLPTTTTSTDKLAARIEELTKINGGFAANDDEDDVDDEEDENIEEENDDEEEEADDEDESVEEGDDLDEEDEVKEENDEDGDDKDEAEEQGLEEEGNGMEDDENEEEDDVDDEESSEKDVDAEDNEEEEDEGDDDDDDDENEEADDDEDEDEDDN